MVLQKRGRQKLDFISLNLKVPYIKATSIVKGKACGSILLPMAMWLDLVPEATGWTLVDTGRLERLVEGLSHPETQYPSLIWFAGNGNRIKALQALFPHNNITRRGPSGLTRLHISTQTANTENPVLFAESGIFNDSGVGESKLCRWSTETFQRYHICQKGRMSSLEDIRPQVIRNVLFTWAQVLCFFVDTPSEMRKVLELLEGPCRKVRIGSRSVPSFTRVIIVLTCSTEPDAETIAKCISQYLSEDPRLHITFLDLRHRLTLSPQAAFEPLRGVVLDQAQDYRTEQIQQGLLFSSVHLCTLWARTLELEMRSSENLPLDCLQVARETHKLNLVSADHLVRFLDHANDLGCTTEAIHAFIASALLMNAYPPGMHRK